MRARRSARYFFFTQQAARKAYLIAAWDNSSMAEIFSLAAETLDTLNGWSLFLSHNISISKRRMDGRMDGRTERRSLSVLILSVCLARYSVCLGIRSV